MSFVKITQEAFDKVIKILEGDFEDAITHLQIARLSQVPQQRLSEWCRQGNQDITDGIDSLCAQLSVMIEQKRGEIVKHLVREILSRNTFQGNSWILEKCFPKEFGNDSATLEEMKELHKEMREWLKKGDK
jgi:DNA polymerase III delta prime subunit